MRRSWFITSESWVMSRAITAVAEQGAERGVGDADQRAEIGDRRRASQATWTIALATRPRRSVRRVELVAKSSRRATAAAT